MDQAATPASGYPQKWDVEQLQTNIRWACIISLGLEFIILGIDLIGVILEKGKPIPYGSYRLMATIAISYAALWFNQRTTYRVSAGLFMASHYLGFIFYPLIPYYDNLTENLILLAFLSLVTSVMPYVIYNLKRDTVWVVAWILTILVTTFFAFRVTLNRMVDTDIALLAHQLLDQYMIQIGYFSTLLFLHGTLFYFKRNLETQRDNIAQKHEKLSSQQAEILAQRDNLEELNQVKDQIFSIIAHDLRSPLNSLHNILSLFQQGNNLTTHELQSLLNKVGRKVQNVSTLLNNLLYWAMSQMNAKMTMKPKYLTVKPFVQETFRLYEEVSVEKHIKITAAIPGDLPPILADEDALRLVLRNLIANALKFTHPYGKVQVSASHIPGAIRIDVSDTGIGMSKEQIQRVLSGTVSQSVLGTQNEKGTGLGLLITKEFLERNGGALGIRSEPLEGTTVYFTLPLAPNQHPMAAELSGSYS
ncbi:MAG TPA: hypothetical protein DCE41_10080 [Cytophagales bacterium]|nr:hypothetical protein [Cytophagales bacterium]HAA22090.1 hypothetical protein [Cytophagales bacterium]HAP59508.1 hypothetical protein [Cytophagales bacterium]